MNMIWAIRDSVRISFTGGTGMRRAYVVMALVLSFLFITILWGGGTALHAEDHTGPVSKQGKKWRIGYLEGNEKDEYADYLRAVVKGLIELDWVQPILFPKILPPYISGNGYPPMSRVSILSLSMMPIGVDFTMKS